MTGIRRRCCLLALVAWILSPALAVAQSTPLTSASVTVPLVAPGTEFLPRLRQLDLSLAKWFQMGRTRLQGQLDIFNVFNTNTEVSYRSTNYNTPAYVQPSSVLQGRMLRVGMQVRWEPDASSRGGVATQRCVRV